MGTCELRFLRVVVVVSHKPVLFGGHLDLSRAAVHLVELSCSGFVFPINRFGQQGFYLPPTQYRQVSPIDRGSAWWWLHCFFFSYLPPLQNLPRRWKARSVFRNRKQEPSWILITLPVYYYLCKVFSSSQLVRCAGELVWTTALFRYQPKLCEIFYLHAPR